MPSINTETRIDIQALATLAKYYIEEKGTSPGNRASIIRTALEDYTRLLVANNNAIPIKDNEQALEYLKRMNIMQKSRKASKNFFSDMSTTEESMRIDFGEREIDESAKKIASMLRQVKEKGGDGIISPSQDSPELPFNPEGL